MPKFIFVTGGVLSSLGKGIFSSSLGRILKSCGHKVSIMKIDPYLNCDAGTLNPFEHGEVFVTRDGFECDLDIGNYERFLNEFARREQNLMMGSAYRSIIERERKGEFLGQTLQLIPHATNEIKNRIRIAAKTTGADILIVEIGGTVGDIEGEVVLEAIRQMKFEEPPDSTLYIHLALLPTIITGEQKTKPMQHSVKELLGRGITPGIVVGRSEAALLEATRKKIALFCNVAPEEVFYSRTVQYTEELPLILLEQGLQKVIERKLGLKSNSCKLNDWEKLVSKMKNLENGVRIAVIGKYATTKDTYMSVFEAIKHAGLHNDVKIDAVLIDSEKIESGEQSLEGFQGFVVPGGFGERGVEGIITAIKYARENDIPYLGLCYGLQLAIIEFARNKIGWKDAHTTEIDSNTKHGVIDFLPEQKEIDWKGGTMRLGVRDVKVIPGTKAFELYGTDLVQKRFRHRYEVNPEFIPDLEKAGMVISGKDPEREIMKIGELKDHPFFMGTQFHPEFDSRLTQAEPLFDGFIKAAKQTG
ncbi:MAG: CTP synthase [Candidatus Micrarchaeota archaeon]